MKKQEKKERRLSPLQRIRQADVKGYWIACSPIYGYTVMRREDRRKIWSHPGAAQLTHKMVDEMARAVADDRRRKREGGEA